MRWFEDFSFNEFDIFRFSLGATFEKLNHTVHYLGDFDDKELEHTIQSSNTKAVREKLRPGIDCVTSNSREETIEPVYYF